MHLNGKTIKMSFKGKSMLEICKGLNTNDSEKGTLGAHLPPTRDNMLLLYGKINIGHLCI